MTAPGSEEIIDSIDQHFRLGADEINAVQLREHKRRLSCSECDINRRRAAEETRLAGVR